MPTSNNAATEGQIKRVDHTMKRMLKVDFKDSFNDWYDAIPFMEFFSSDSFQKSIRCSPFCSGLAIQPRTASLIKPLRRNAGFNQDAKKFMQQVFAIIFLYLRHSSQISA